MTAAQRPEPLDVTPIEARVAAVVALDRPALQVMAMIPPDYAGPARELIEHSVTDLRALLAEVRRLRSAMTAAQAYRDAQQRVEAVAAQHIAPTSSRLARVVPADAVESLAVRLGRLADATEIVPEVPR